MSSWPGLVAGALVIGTIIGVLFQYTYSSIDMSPQLGLLFALVGLILTWLIQAGWKLLQGKRR